MFPLPAVALSLVLVAAPSGPPAPSHPRPDRGSHAAVWPLRTGGSPPQIAARFDPPDQAWSAGHRGVDLVGSLGQPVLAAMAGTVTFAGTIAGRGVVVVSHGGSRTTYEPVEAVVQDGQPVSAGSMIGSLQAVGGHCPPRTCLHWGLIVGETYADPLSLLGLGPVRLLPLGGL